MSKISEPSSTVHPPDSEVMSNAILILEDQGGSSRPAVSEKEVPKEQRAARKTRRLSQVETPEALRKATRKRKAMPSGVGGPNGGKMKRLSEVKTPEGFKKGDKKKIKKTKMKTATAAPPVKRKSLKRASSSKPAKKGGK
ncbi:histone H1-II-like [Syzygium oleosum]|uniref:histone H1-II-like n=1 Tax=Syzygium oleosum TaxID=219896 RepID=UPI0024BA9827|nr:histone H1-II-like [Syzygium oleosum]